MKYKIYYKSTGFITGILTENDLSNQSNYESQIDYDSVIDLESDMTDEDIFFDCKISDGALVKSESDERKKIRETKIARQNRKLEYPPLEEQLDKIYHGGVDAWKAEIKAIKDKYPKPS